MNQQSEPNRPLRIVGFHMMTMAYDVVQDWMARHGHQMILLVTTPGPASRRNISYLDLIRELPPQQEVIISTKMKHLVPYIQSLEPDLLVSYTFPYRIPPEMVSIPRFGAVNLHPTPLPQYRGPNPLRLLYDGYPTMGATLHWTAKEYDTGNILSQHTQPVPDEGGLEEVFPLWRELMVRVLEEGVPAAIAGEPGVAQDHSLASDSPEFTRAEEWLDWSLPKTRLQRQTGGMLMFGRQPRTRFGDREYEIFQIEPFDDGGDAAPGTVLERTSHGFRIQTGDGSAIITARPVEMNES